MSTINVNVRVRTEGLGATADPIATKYGGKMIGHSGLLRSYAVPTDNLSAFMMEVREDPNVEDAVTNPPESERNLKKLTIEGQRELIEEVRPKISILNHIAYSSTSSQKMDITDIMGHVYENVGHDFRFTDGISFVYEECRYYIPLTSILSIKMRNPNS